MALVVNIKNNNNIFERNTALVDYYEDIRKLDGVMTPEDEELYFYYLKHGSEKEKENCRKKLIEANQRFVVSVARNYASNNNLLDLINEGNIGLMEAIDAFDPSVKRDGKTVKFTTFAVYYIRRAINHFKVNHGAIVKKNNISKTYHVLSQARNKFLQENGRQPTPDELKEILNTEYDLKIRSTNDLLDLKVTYIDDNSSDDDDDSNLGNIATYNSYSANGNAYEKTSHNDYNKKLISSLLSVLTEREQTVIKMAYGIGEDRIIGREFTNEEIAAKVGLTTERIRQMKSSIIVRLKSEFKRKLNSEL